MQKLFGRLLCLFSLLVPFDHRYDKWCRYFSLKLIPEGLPLPLWYEKKIYIYPSDILSILLFILALYAFQVHYRKMLFEKSAPWLIALFLLCFASVAVSPLFSYPIAYFRLLQLLTPILLFMAVSHCGKEWAESVLWCLCIGGSFQALIAIGQYFLQQPLGLHILGELKLSHQAGEIPCPNGARWIFDHIFDTFTDSKTLRRASGTFNHSNPLGSFLLVSIFSSFALFRTRPRLMAACISLMIFALILTFSRSAFFAGLIGALVYFYKAKPAAVLYRIIGISLAISCLLFGEQILQRGGIFNYNRFTASSDSVRMEQNHLALKMIAKHPLLGVGYQQFTYTPEFNDFSRKEAITMVHNSLLLVAAESGLFALFCLGGFFYFSLKRGWAVDSEIGAAGFSLGVAFCLIANSDFYPFLFQHAKMSLFLMLGLMMAKEDKVVHESH
jgi:hypothetical protein